MSFLKGKPLQFKIQNIVEILHATASEAPQQEIVFYDGKHEETLSYAQLLAKAQIILSGLQTAGLARGDHLILHLKPAREMLPTFWACILGSFVLTTSPIPAHYSPSNIEIRKLKNSWEKLAFPKILASASLCQRLRDSLKNPAIQILSWDELPQSQTQRPFIGEPVGTHQTALQLQTSGTTGAAKLVQLSHQCIIAHVTGAHEVLSLSRADVSLNWMSLHHVGALIMCHIRDLYLQCRQIHIPTELVKANPLFWLQSIGKYRATISWGPHNIYGRLADMLQAEKTLQLDLSSVRYLINGGDQIVAVQFRSFLQHLAKYGLFAHAGTPAWGMTETASAATLHLNSEQDDFDFAARGLATRGVSVGRPLPNLSVKVVDDQGEIVPQGVQGTLKIKGNQVSSAYYKNEKANRESFDANGWFDTGDLARIVADKLEITGRAKDIVIINGLNVFCHEIEEGLSEHFNIVRSEVVVVAFRQANDVADHIALFYKPPETKGPPDFSRYIYNSYGLSKVFLVFLPSSEFPKNDMGKIQRARLQRHLQENFENMSIIVQRA